MKALVLGGNGHLGRELQVAAAAGSVDAVFTRSPAPSASHLPVVDVTDRRSVRSAIEDSKPDVVLHLASITGAAADLDPARAEAVNVESVGYVSEAAAAAGVPRVVYVSSASVYGDRYESPVAENAPLDPRSTYAETKIRAEEALVLAAAAGGPEAVILRIFNIVGAGFEHSLVSKLLASRPEAPVPLRDLDGFVRDYIRIDDVLPALLASFRASVAGRSRIYNIGSGIPVSNRELLTILSERQPVYYEPVDGEPSYSCADIGRASRELGLIARPL